MSIDKNPEEWGQKIVDGCFVPVDTDLDAASAELMDFVRCKCKIDSRRPCSSQICTCVKHGLPCLTDCKNCNGQVCENASELQHISNSASQLLEEDDIEDNDVFEDTEESCLSPTDSDTFLENFTPFHLPWIL